MIRITAKKAGFRRAGLAHSATPTDYPDDFFDAAQLRALYGEPMLVVETLPDSSDSSDSSDQKRLLDVGEGERSGHLLPPFDGEMLREAPATGEPMTAVAAGEGLNLLESAETEKPATGKRRSKSAANEQPASDAVTNVTPSPSGEGVGDAGAP